MSDSDNEHDVSKLAREVIAELDSGRYGDKFVFSRRQVIALAGAGLSVGALTTLGVDEATAQEAVGQVGTASEPVDVEAARVNAGSLSTKETHTEKIGANAYHYAGDYDGLAADERLDNAIASAQNGHTIYLETGDYTKNRTIDKRLTIIGPSANDFSAESARISSDWTISASRTYIAHVGVNDDCELALSGRCEGHRLFLRGGSTVRATGDEVLLSHIGRSGTVIYDSGTSDGVIGVVSGNVTITDNGTNRIL